MAQIVYNDKIVAEHTIAQRGCMHLLDELAESDYHKRGYFDERIRCLSLDEYEEKVCGGSKDNTMDAAVGICDYVNNRVVNSRLMLVELRMGYDSADNLSRSSLEHKITHSRNLLVDTRMEKTNFFVFTDTIAPKAKSWATRMAYAARLKSDWEILGVTQFNELLNFESDMPYHPIHDVDAIKKGLLQCMDSMDWEKLFAQTGYWKELAETYRTQYKVLEFNSIINTLWGVWQTVDPQNYRLNQDDDACIEIELWKEEIHNLY